MLDEVEVLYRKEARRVFATLVRLLGDFDLAEDALQEAFKAALKQWPGDGIPANPHAWLISTGRFKAIDYVRRQRRFDVIREQLLDHLEDTAPPDRDTEAVQDDRLRLIFTCCHPSLADPVKIALTLREVCGLSTEAIANAFLIKPSTMAQRLVRGKNKIKAAGIPYEVPSHGDLAERLDSVLTVIYLIFNEGYHASGGEALTRTEMSQEAIRLGRLLAELLPDSEVLGLLALMLLQESRRDARLSATGELVLLEEQDRRTWNWALIGEAQSLIEKALSEGEVGTYTLEAAIAAVHAEAREASDTDWQQIVALYDLLMQASPSPVVALNHAVAAAMAEGPDRGLALIEPLRQTAEIKHYHLLHAARADLLRRLGRSDEAKDAYRTAISLTSLSAERRFLERRLRDLS